MRLYAAFDLHSSNSYLGIVEESGKRKFKKRLRDQPELISETLLPFKDDISLAGRVSKEAIDSLTRQIWAIEAAVEMACNPLKILVSRVGFEPTTR